LNVCLVHYISSVHSNSLSLLCNILWYRFFYVMWWKKTKPQIVNNEKEEKYFFVDSQLSVFSSFQRTNFMRIDAEKNFWKNFSKTNRRERNTKLSYPLLKCDHKQNWAREGDTKNNYCTSLDLIFNLKFNFMAFWFSTFFFSTFVPSPPSLNFISSCFVARSLCLFISSLDFFSEIK
jgi:hypothetical protein